MPVARGTRRPLDSAQFGIWFAVQLAPHSPWHNLAEGMEIHGPVDEVLFEQAFRRVIEDHDALRVVFREDEEGMPEQTVLDRLDWSLDVIDMSAEDDPRESALAWMDDEAATPVDLAAGPPFTSVLLRLSADAYIWYKRMHHIMVDGHGIHVVTRRAADVYSRLVAGEPVPEADPGGVAELVDEDIAYRASGRFEADRVFWNERLHGLGDPPTLSDRAPGPETYHCLRSVRLVSQEQVTRYRSAARACATTWAALVNAATAAYLHRCTGATDISIGNPVSGRKGQRRTVGMTSSYVPLRLSLTERTTAAELTRSATRGLRDIMKHQRYRYEDIRRDLRLTQSARPVIGPTISFLPFRDFEMSFGGHRVTGHTVSFGSSVRDMAVNVFERGGDRGAEFFFDADPAAYTQEELDQHADRFIRFVDAFAAAPETPIGALPV
ncbi:condensation domain-containing protein [Streptomyces fuscichromogenes]|uniref:Condensation domain-containing protein n=1 Tax=Streptomyces fuscichromogenes TaxID=1324013 RepID=A0A918CVF9_9ACTN|nr:condensation domain-containing protein [Streptomyces fuscichromogenes]GGN34782.1 hypothetical protein GCM10011578_076020 [Streptomyces fuscichromogenes]